jgi:TRAP-type mannitol/chloroaromatic compound transport system permease large subunit
MFGTGEMLILVAVLLGLVFAGVHIAVALGCAAMLGIYLMTGDFQVVASFVGSTAYEAVRDYVFAVIPLFMLMGEFLAKCGAATDLFSLFNRLTRIVPGRLAVATVISNAVFAFVTGVSIAAAAAFSRIAYPEMKRHGYEDRFALGCIAGSACLGMLIPGRSSPRCRSAICSSPAFFPGCCSPRSTWSTSSAQRRCGRSWSAKVQPGKSSRRESRASCARC